MTASTNRQQAAFEPRAYRQSIAEMFGVLTPDKQRELIDKLAVLPRHIHDMAVKGLIAG